MSAKASAGLLFDLYLLALWLLVKTMSSGFWAAISFISRVLSLQAVFLEEYTLRVCIWCYPSLYSLDIPVSSFNRVHRLFGSTTSH
jgi:hypothetical protein